MPPPTSLDNCPSEIEGPHPSGCGLLFIHPNFRWKLQLLNPANQLHRQKVFMLRKSLLSRHEMTAGRRIRSAVFYTRKHTMPTVNRGANLFIQYKVPPKVCTLSASIFLHLITPSPIIEFITLNVNRVINSML